MNIESIGIRDLRISDVESVAEIRIKGWQTTYAGQMPDDFLKNLSLERTIARWREVLSNPEKDRKAIGAFKDRKLIGYISIGPSRGENEFNYGEIYAIYVEPDLQGMGIGTRLMSESISHFISLGYSYATLWVLHSNTAAIGFYEVKGWNFSGKTKVESLGDFEILEHQYVIQLPSQGQLA